VSDVVVIIGGGVAGLSMAWALARRGVGDVVVLEREEQPGMHATGRSAASLVELDPHPVLQRLKIGGAAFLRAPPPGFSDVPLLDQTGILELYREPELGAVVAAIPDLEAQGARLVPKSPAEVAASVDIEASAIDGGVLLPDDGRIDVHALLTGYARGAALRRKTTVTGVVVERGAVRGVVTESGETISARWVVDAAGAWAGPIARLAGAAPIPIAPLRRSIATFAAPADREVARWPLVASVPHHLYFAPESGGLLLSPMDETPSEPCDARADDVTIAAAIERLRALAPRLAPTTLRRRWAGLRSFAPDRALVVGADPLVRGFFWLAGQGGCGLETSPFVAQIAADLLVDGKTERFDAALLAPERFV